MALVDLYDSNGKLLHVKSEIFHESAAETTTGTSTAIDAGNVKSLIVALDVTVASVSDTLDVIIEESVDNSVWFTLLTFTQATGVTSEILRSARPARYLRATWTIGGTSPSFTFSLKGLVGDRGSA